MRRALSLLLLLFAAPLAASLHAQDVYWVDPVLGADDPQRTGAEAEPYRTISYAVSRQNAGRALTVLLVHGFYLEEDWPIAVGPDDLAIEAPVTGSAYVYGFGSSFENFQLDAGSGALSLKGFTLVGAQYVVRANASGPPGSRLNVLFDRMSVLGGVLFTSILQGDQELDLTLLRCWFRGVDAGLRLNLGERASASVAIRRTRIFRVGAGIDAIAHGPDSSYSIEMENSVISGCLLHAIRLESGGGPGHLAMVHCNLKNNGRSSIPNRPAIRIYPPSPGASTPTVEIRRSILWANGADIGAFAQTGGNYTFESNLVEDPALAGLGGNLVADPLWAAGGDNVLLPASPARGAGAPGTPVDFFGHPRGAAATDLGAFEHTLFTLGLNAGTWLGSGQEIVVTGPPDTGFAVFVGQRTVAGPGLQVDPLWIGNPLFRGRLDGAGFGSHTVVWPPDFRYAGQRLYLQVVGKDASGTLHFGEVVPVVLSRAPHAT